jgi:hypothetical protein
VSVRKTNYGPRPVRPDALATTREAIAAQPPGAAFDTAPPTKDWRCPCGFLNADSRKQCRVCGAQREGDKS